MSRVEGLALGTYRPVYTHNSEGGAHPAYKDCKTNITMNEKYFRL